MLRCGGDSRHSRIAQHFWRWEFTDCGLCGPYLAKNERPLCTLCNVEDNSKDGKQSFSAGAKYLIAPENSRHSSGKREPHSEI